jgi:hypothetical protein
METRLLVGDFSLLVLFGLCNAVAIAWVQPWVLRWLSARMLARVAAIEAGRECYRKLRGKPQREKKPRTQRAEPAKEAADA